MSAGRVSLGLVGFAMWAYGLVRFLEGSEAVGGLLVLAGGLAFVIALRGGWGQFWEGVVNWLYGLGR
jgi:hypothetical protein